jgi:hypothetical protein
MENFWAEWLNFDLGGQGRTPPSMAAIAQAPAGTEDEVCIAAPDSGYRGVENQLYRVEVHAVTGEVATMKWSRDNGTAVYPIDTITGAEIAVLSLGRDRRLGIEVGDWVEIVDDDQALRPRAEALHLVVDVDPLDLVVTLADPPLTKTGRDPDRHPLLRRWDQQPAGDPADWANGLPIVRDQWMDLEDGVRVKFGNGGEFRTGDYWLVPARVQTGDVAWPDGGDASSPRAPFGTLYRYAPLAIVSPTGTVTTLRKTFAPLAPLP